MLLKFTSRKKSITSLSLIAGAALFSALTSHFAHAAVTLKQVQAVEGDRVEVMFDGRIQKSQVRSEVLGDIVQLTISDADVYPAKISNLSGHSVRKVFAYQYAPRVVRVRLSVRDKVDPANAANVVQFSTSGKTLSVVVKNGADTQSDTVRSGAAHSESAVSAEEARLAARVTESSNATSAKETAKAAKSAKDATSEEKTPIAGGKNVGSPLAAFGKLMGVLLLFLVIAMSARKLLARRSGLTDRLGKWSGLKAKGPIEVIATHYLGPKKSIAVVRVGGRELVLGITDEAINLITQMHQSIEDELHVQQESKSNLQAPSIGSPNAGDAVANAFASALVAASATPQAAAPQASKSSAVRSQIRSRLEGMKQL